MDTLRSINRIRNVNTSTKLNARRNANHIRTEFVTLTMRKSATKLLIKLAVLSYTKVKLGNVSTLRRLFALLRKRLLTKSLMRFSPYKNVTEHLNKFAIPCTAWKMSKKPEHPALRFQHSRAQRRRKSYMIRLAAPSRNLTAI